MSNRHIKRYSLSQIVKEMQMKTTRHYLTLVRIAVNRKNKKQSWSRCEEKGTLIHC